MSSEKKNVFKNLKDRLYGFSYTTRVTVTFALIAVMTATVAVGVLSYVWEQHFQVYTRENVQTLAEKTAENISAHYESAHSEQMQLEGDGAGEADPDAEEGAGAPPVPAPPSVTINDISSARTAAAISQGIGVQVVNAEGAVIYDSSLVEASAGDPSVLMFDQTLAPPDPAAAVSVPIESNGVKIGTVRMWVYGSELLLSKSDQEFRAKSYQAMVFAAALSIVLASCIGFLFARGLVNPINRMTKTAAAIKEGDLSARTNLEGNDEIAELGKTFDAMAESVEKDRELERRLTTDVAHELRTPLMAIQSTVEAIVDGVFEPDEERLGTVNAEVQRLSRLVDALLKLSRLENRSSPMREEVVNVGELIRSLVISHEAFVADSGLELHYEAEDDVMVYGDCDMIRQATANLISNAVRYTPAGGRIDVKVSKGDIMASIAVKDTGIGLSPEECKMVFSRFWRAEQSRERESGGLGVGLAVVKEIVDRHGGWVKVEGKKGEGACFTILIPLYDYHRIKALKERQEGSRKPNGKGKNHAKGRK